MIIILIIMNYITNFFGLNDNALISDNVSNINKHKINFIQYAVFDTIYDADNEESNNHDTDEKNKSIEYFHMYVTYITTRALPNNFIKLSDETIISNNKIINPNHYITELINCFESEEKLIQILATDLPRSNVRIHNLSETGINQITQNLNTLEKFKEILSKYDKHYLTVTKSGFNPLDKLSLSKLFMVFCNQVSQPPLMEYATYLYPGKYLLHPKNGLVNYDIIFNKNKIILQSSVTKSVVSDLSRPILDIDNLFSTRIILSTNIIITLNDYTKTFAIKSIKFINYDA